ncbi:MAG: hypothetical protein HYY49_08245 [Ignavibacteriales bacterium]|nr:hypothetical protein [Ignavibacteriales bacterium]
MRHRRLFARSFLLFLIVPISFTFCQIRGEPNDEIFSLAVLGISSKELSPEQIEQLNSQLSAALRGTGRFQLAPTQEVQKILTGAKLQVQDCYSIHCLAEAGKILGVQRVLQGNVERRGKFYQGYIKIVDPASTSVVASKSWEFSGEFEGFLSTSQSVASDLAGKRDEIQTNKKWYLIAAAILTVGATILFINKTLGAGKDQGIHFEGSGGDDPPPPPTN